jgi:hypothetical protein
MQILSVIVFAIIFLSFINFHLPNNLYLNVFAYSTEKIHTNSDDFYDLSNKIEYIINNTNISTLNYYLNKLINEYKGRVTGTNVCDTTSDWIYDEFGKMENLKVEKQFWRNIGNIYHKFKLYQGYNIVAELDGLLDTKEYYVFSAHYDCGNKDSQGALDNAAGVAALVTVAKALSQFEFNYSIKFIAFSGEEQGLLGSYYYAKEAYENGDNILGVLNADVIGNNTYSTNKHFLLRAFSPESGNRIIEKMNYTSNKYNIGITVSKDNYQGHSDDKAFDDYGFPAMHLFQSGNNMECYYGNANDTIKLINLSYLLNVSKLIATSLAVLADENIEYPFCNIFIPRENCLQIGKNIIMNILSKGLSINIGSFLIELNLNKKNLEKVKYEIFVGENEIKSKQERIILKNVTINNYPFNFFVNERLLGWHTIRVTFYDGKGDFWIDEIEIFCINI